jgi:hypothetical protein
MFACEVIVRTPNNRNEHIRWSIVSGFAAFRAVRLCLTGTSIYFEAMPQRDIRGVASKE